jgi:hypothetical protein
LSVFPPLCILERPWNADIGLDSSTFDPGAVPTLIGRNRKDELVAGTDFGSSPRDQTPRSLCADDLRQRVLLCEQRHHLRGARRVFIDQNHDVPMKGLRAKALRLKNNRLFCAESYSQRDELPFLRWNFSQSRKTLFRSATLRCRAIQTVAYGLPSRCEQTHEP